MEQARWLTNTYTNLLAFVGVLLQQISLFGIVPQGMSSPFSMGNTPIGKGIPGFQFLF
jgi:hypothetical protein